MSQAQAAALLGVSLRTWQFWENGKHEMHRAFFRLFQLETRQATIQGGSEDR